MEKYYFFRTVRNGGFLKLRALPGQTTYLDYSHQNSPVNIEWDVQSEREARTIQCAYPEGTIFGACLTGSSLRSVKLLVHSRNGVSHYRLEGSLTYPLSVTRFTDPSHAPSQEMLRQWNVFSLQNGGQRTAEPATSAPQAAQPSMECSTLLRLASAPESYIRSMTIFVEGSDRQGNLLKLSQLRDRMLVGVAKFSYRKQNGDVRVAYGTKIPEFIRNFPGCSVQAPSSSSQDTGAHFRYFDIQRRDWRCFCVADFIGTDESVLITNTDRLADIPNSVE